MHFRPVHELGGWGAGVVHGVLRLLGTADGEASTGAADKAGKTKHHTYKSPLL